jgi:ribosomal protein L18E
MNKIFLKEILDVLTNVQQELSKHAESNVNLELNRIIEELKGEIDKDVGINANDVLVLIGKVLDHAPAITRLIELLSNLT